MTAGLRALPVVAAAVLSVIGTGANATTTTVEIDGSYTISYARLAGHTPSLTDKLGQTKHRVRTFTEKLTLDADDPTTSVAFFTASPTSTCGPGCDAVYEPVVKGHSMTYKPYYVASGTITVDFNFSNVTVLTGDTSETGLYQAKYGGMPLTCALASGAGDTDCITWDKSNDPLSLKLSDGYTLDIILSDAEDWAITPKISFQLTTTPVSNPPPPETPLPATLTLFASGFGLLGLLCMRRKKRPTLWDVQRTSP